MNTGQQKQKQKDEPIKYRDDLIHRRNGFLWVRTHHSVLFTFPSKQAPQIEL